MTWLLIIAGIMYLVLLLGLATEALHYKPRQLGETANPVTDFKLSVIVCYRNEAAHLPALLKDFKNQKLLASHWELFLVNDASTDESIAISTAFKEENQHLNITLLNRIVTTASAKKDGITQAIALAKYPIITLTDADCNLPANWMSTVLNHYKELPHTKFVAMPVVIQSNNSLLTALQHIEMMALQLITLGGFSRRQPFMCNGANMSFTKSAFYEVNSYDGNSHLSSGDDVFLLEKIAALYPEHSYYLKHKDAIVTTLPAVTFNTMIEQRVRWSQKGSHTKSLLNKLIALQVLITSLFFLLLPVFLILEWIDFNSALAFLLIKLFTDLCLLIIASTIFNIKSKRWIPELWMLYPLVVVIIALCQFKKPQWHHRTINEPAV